MNKKYLIIGAILLVGGYIAYKKFFLEKDEESTDTSTKPSEAPIDRGIVPPVVSDAPSLVVPSATTSLVRQTGGGSASFIPTDNVATQSAPSSNFSYAGLGKY